MASGSLSRCTQIEATVARCCGAISTPARAARWPNSSTASASRSGRTATVASPGTRSGSRLVARTCILVQGGSSAATSAAQAPSRCSQVSRMSSRCRSRSWSTSTSRRLRVNWSGSRSAAAMVCGSSASSRSASSRSSRLPSAKLPAAALATARLTAVLPTPGGPVTVTSRAPSSAYRIVATSAALPMRPPGGSPGIGRPLHLHDGSPRSRRVRSFAGQWSGTSRPGGICSNAYSHT